MRPLRPPVRTARPPTQPAKAPAAVTAGSRSRPPHRRRALLRLPPELPRRRPHRRRAVPQPPARTARPPLPRARVRAAVMAACKKRQRPPRRPRLPRLLRAPAAACYSCAGGNRREVDSDRDEVGADYDGRQHRPDGCDGQVQGWHLLEVAASQRDLLEPRRRRRVADRRSVAARQTPSPAVTDAGRRPRAGSSPSSAARLVARLFRHPALTSTRAAAEAPCLPHRPGSIRSAGN